METFQEDVMLITMDDMKEGRSAAELCQTSLMECDHDEQAIDIFMEAPVHKISPRRRTRTARKPTQKMLESLCRLCEHTSSSKLVNVFSSRGKQLKLADKIHFHLPIRVKENDQLPLGVCISCLKALKICDNLYQSTLKTDTHLREVLIKEDLSKFCTSVINTFDLTKRSKVLVDAIRDAGISSIEKDSTEQYKTLSKESELSSETSILNVGSISINLHPTSNSNNVAVLNDSTNMQDININTAEVEQLSLESWESSSDDNDGDVCVVEDSSEPSVNGDENHEESCDLCESKFSTIAELSEHRKTHSAEERLKCPECGKACANDEAYRSHTKLHKEPPVKCEVCGAVLANRHCLKRHMIVHEEPKFCCQVCGKRARSITKLQQHMVAHTNERPYSCKKCGMKFKTKVTLRQHEAVHSNTPSRVCDICGRAFHRKSHLDRHLERHRRGTASKTNSRLTCHVCTLTYTCHENLSEHMIAAHGAEKDDVLIPIIFCDVCDDTLPTKTALNRHKYYSHGIKAAKAGPTGSIYKCIICGVNLKSKRALVYHTFCHTGERPFPCRYCDLRFKAQESRERHERKHTGERPFKCKFCDKSFLCMSTLCQHNLTHTGEKKFQCNLCPYKTVRKAALRVHLRHHTGEKPYSCSMCGKSYKTLWDLKRHSAVHTGEARPKRVRPKPHKTTNRKTVEDESSNSGINIYATTACDLEVLE